MNIWEEYAHFIDEFRREFNTTGALLPSGRFLARGLARPLRGPRQPWRILEVGPGTGSVTREIARRMLPGDRLEAVEINPRFAEVVEQRVARERLFAPHREHIEIVRAGVEELVGESTYDLIVSGLPLNNFSSTQVRGIFSAFTRLIRPGGLLSYFEYVMVRELKTPFVNRQERRRLIRIGRLMRRYIRRYQVRSDPIVVNVPPAIVRQLCLKPLVESLPVAATPLRTRC